MSLKEQSMSKEKFITEVQTALNDTTDARNRMGCSENWYNPYYAIGKTFSIDELSQMDMKQLNNLYKLADKMSSALY